MTDPTAPNRPLVTFALFAYNQEQYIREAVEGAFSQTYEPLEIILSDDCSSDRTFAIMQEMAARYNGPNQVIVRQSRHNMGTLGHVLTVAHAAKGNIFVVSAGDDISFPDRVEKTVASLSTSSACAYSGDDIIIDEMGNEINCDIGRKERRNRWHKENPAWTHGATAAYKTAFLKNLPIPLVKVFYEDMVFIDLLKNTAGKSVRDKRPLIKYRYHLHNASNRISTDNTIEATEERAIGRWQRARDAKKYCYDVLLTRGLGNIEPASIRRVSNEYRYFEYISEWQSISLMGRVKLAYFAALTGNIRFALPRIFGKKWFTLLKRFRHA